MPPQTYTLLISDEQLQAKAEELEVRNFAKKARKVLNVLQGELGRQSNISEKAISGQLTPAIKYAGVSFTTKELESLWELMTFKASK